MSIAAKYTFNENSNTIVLDYSGNGNDATRVNDLSVASGELGEKGRFNGLTSELRFGNIANFDGTTAMSIFVKIEKILTGENVIAWKDGAFELRIDASENVVFKLTLTTGEQTLTSSGTIGTDFTTIGAVYDGVKMYIYIAGSEDATAEHTEDIAASSNELFIGSNSSDFGRFNIETIEFRSDAVSADGIVSLDDSPTGIRYKTRAANGLVLGDLLGVDQYNNDIRAVISFIVDSQEFYAVPVSGKLNLTSYPVPRGNNGFDTTRQWVAERKVESGVFKDVVYDEVNTFTLPTPRYESNKDNLIVNQPIIFSPSSIIEITAGGGITITKTEMDIQGSGGAVDITVNPQIVAGIAGQFVMLHGRSDTNTVQLDDGNGVHIHGRAIIGDGDKMGLVYDEIDSVWSEVFRNFVDIEKGWSFDSPSAVTGDFYFAGFYDHASTDNDFSSGPTHGVANWSHASHFFTVLGANTVDTLTIRITGTSITDAAVRTINDTEDLVYAHPSLVDEYRETEKKWIGQVTITVLSGTAKTCNYGFAKYWDNNNNDYKILGLEATWLAGANDSAANIIAVHHKPTGWTFNSGSIATHPPSIADMNTDHVTEIELINNLAGAWKRDDLNLTVAGSQSEGFIIHIVTSANKAFEQGTFRLRIRPN